MNKPLQKAPCHLGHPLRREHRPQNRLTVDLHPHPAPPQLRRDHDLHISTEHLPLHPPRRRIPKRNPQGPGVRRNQLQKATFWQRDPSHFVQQSHKEDSATRRLLGVVPHFFERDGPVGDRGDPLFPHRIFGGFAARGVRSLHDEWGCTLGNTLGVCRRHRRQNTVFCSAHNKIREGKQPRDFLAELLAIQVFEPKVPSIGGVGGHLSGCDGHAKTASAYSRSLFF